MYDEKIGDLWRLAVKEITINSKKLVNLYKPEELKHLIDAISLFNETMKVYSYDITPLLELISDLSEQCADIALQNTHEIFVTVTHYFIFPSISA